jgi:hypothetical protein
MNDTDTSVKTDKTLIDVASLRNEQILVFFACGHLPPHLRAVSEPFADLATHIMTLPRSAERTTALRKLLESKDCAVRAEILRGEAP